MTPIDPDRHCEERSDEAIHLLRLNGLLRFARNDGRAATNNNEQQQTTTNNKGNTS